MAGTLILFSKTIRMVTKLETHRHDAVENQFRQITYVTLPLKMQNYRCIANFIEPIIRTHHLDFIY